LNYIDWDYCSGSSTNVYFPQDDYNSDAIENLSGARLWKYLQNNYGKIYSNYTKSYINTFTESCVFTGFCADDVFLTPIVDFLKTPTNITFRELIENCVHECIKSGCDDWEYTKSEGAVTEIILENNYEFTADGNLFKLTPTNTK